MPSRDGADYIGFGPVFHTTTKDAGRPKGIEMLREIKRQVRIPVVAIGGITAENIRPVLEAGADAVAVSSAILRGDIEENTKRFLEIIKLHGHLIIKSPLPPLCQRGGLLPPFGKGRLGGILQLNCPYTVLIIPGG